MTLSCLGILTGLFGAVPAGGVVTVPASALAPYSARQVAWAKDCARRHGVRWRVVER